MRTFLLSLFIAASLHAQLVQSFSGGDPLSVGPGTAGYTFTVGAVPLTIQTLGVWDESGIGLSSSHAVGLWDSDQHLIASAVVSPANATDADGFWYVNMVAPIVLPVGRSFTIGAQYDDSDPDFARGNIPSVTTDPRITIGPPVLSNGSGFEFPDLELPQAAAGFFGPNAGFAPVPEPASALLVALLLTLGVGATNVAKFKPAPKGELAHAKRRQPLKESQPPAANRPPETPGNDHGKRPIVPPGINNYATP